MKENSFCVRAHWPAPANIYAFSTTREAGNLATYVGNEEALVEENRKRLQENLALPPLLYWLKQVHGTRVVSLDTKPELPLEADGSFTTKPNTPCIVLSADCLPVLLCCREGRVLAALHAGWRGLQAGILEKGVNALPVLPNNLLAWLGPAISKNAYEVGEEVRQAFIDVDLNAATAFHPSRPNHWYADLYHLARQRLQSAGVHAIYGGEYCTHQDPRFFSYRREAQTGRQATIIYCAPN